MKLLIDARAASLFTPSTQDGGRHYYIAVAPFLAIIRCDDMDLPAARRQCTFHDANVHRIHAA